MKITANLIVDRIEPVLEFWKKLGFDKVVEVPHEDALGFVILAQGDVQLMYQTRASLGADVPVVAKAVAGNGTVLFIEVEDLETIERALKGVTKILPRRTTFYGMQEIGVREPGGHVVMFAQRVA